MCPSYTKHSNTECYVSYLLRGTGRRWCGAGFRSLTNITQEACPQIIRLLLLLLSFDFRLSRHLLFGLLFFLFRLLCTIFLFTFKLQSCFLPLSLKENKQTKHLKGDKDYYFLLQKQNIHFPIITFNPLHSY